MTTASMLRNVATVVAAAGLGYFLREANEAPRAEVASIPDRAEESPRQSVATERSRQVGADPRVQQELEKLRERLDALEARPSGAEPTADEPLDPQAAITEARVVHETIHRSEAIDTAWSRQHATTLRSELATAYPDLRDVVIDCRTTLCRIDIGHASEDEAEFFRNTPRTDLFRLGAALFSSGLGRSVVYVPRTEGDLPFTLPSESSHARAR